MKENSLSIGRLSALILALAALSVAFVLTLPAAAHAADYTAASADSIAAADVQAPALSAAATTKTVKKHTWTTKLSVAKKCATAVKKGTTKLKFKKEGYVVFKAPKTKTYTLKLSKVKAKEPGCLVLVMVQMSNDSKRLPLKPVTTQGGKDSALHLADKAWADSGDKITTGNHLISRTAKIKLKKGESVYLNFYSTVNYNITLNVK